MNKKRLTKQEMNWINQYADSSCFSVDEAYGRPSQTKRDIETEIKYHMRQYFNGFDYRILSKNGFRFTCAFKYESGDNLFLCVCTPAKWYQIVPLITIDEETGEMHIWEWEYNQYKERRK